VDSYPVRFGSKYLLLERIRFGGMSEVFRAAALGPVGFARTVAIKRILPHLSSEQHFTEMFIDEAKISARLHHPHICQIYDFGSIEDSYFLAMEFVAGVPLRGLQQRFTETGQRLPQEILIRLVCDVLDALNYVHSLTDNTGASLGIIHRDVTPENLLVSFRGEVKLIDFGVAKAASRLAATSSGLKGTWSFMAPEQLEPDGEIDRRTDVFASGLVLHELLTGQWVYPRGSAPSTLERVRRAQIPRPSELEASVPPELDAIVMRALERDPDRRFDSADALRVALQDYCRSRDHHCERSTIAALMEEHFGEDIETEAQRERHFAAVCSEAEARIRDATPEEEERRSPSDTYPGVQVAPPPRPAARGLTVLLVVGLIALVAGFSTLAYLAGSVSHRDNMIPRPEPPPPPPKVVSPAPEPPPAPPNTLHVDSVPRGASLEMKNKDHVMVLPRNSRTPLKLGGLIPGERYLLRATLAQHIPVEREVIWDEKSSRRITLTLPQLPHSARPPPPSPRWRRRPSHHATREQPQPVVVLPATPEPATPRPVADPDPPPAPSPPVTRRPNIPALPAPKVAKPRPAPRSPRPHLSTGTLEVHCQRTAYVFVDDENVGRTPIRVKLPPGKHQVVLVLKDTNTRVLHNVRITAGKRKRLRVRIP